ncbi:hypothetical protein ACJMK2_005257, partial [Sinanodonta woodiana]
ATPTAASLIQASTTAPTIQSSTNAVSTTPSTATVASTSQFSTNDTSTTQSLTNVYTTQSSTIPASTTQASTASPTTTNSIRVEPATQFSTTASPTTQFTTAALSKTNSSATGTYTTQSLVNVTFSAQSSKTAVETQCSTAAQTTQSSSTASATTQSSIIPVSTPMNSTIMSKGFNMLYLCVLDLSTLQCPAEMFKMLIYTNCSGPYNHLQNPSVRILDGCRVYEDLLQCIAFHMMMSGNNMCTVELINHMFLYQYSSFLTRSNGTFLANCTATDIALLQAEVPGQSSQEMCSSISTMRFYMNYVACPLIFSVNLTVEVQCGIVFGILNGIQSFFHGYGFNCEFTQLMSTVSNHEQNSTIPNKLLPSYLLKSLHTCRDVYSNGSLNSNSRLQCAQILANYSCPVVESLKPLINIRNTTVYTSDLKCSTYQSLLLCGLQIANSMDFETVVNCRHGELEILFERVEMDNYALLSNSLPGGLDPVHCSNYSSLFNIKLKLDLEWLESLNNVSSPEYVGMIQKIQQSIDQLVYETFLSDFVSEVKVIQIGWSGLITSMQTDVNLTMKMKSTARMEPDAALGTLISAILNFISINPSQEIIQTINILSISLQSVYSEPSICTPERFKDLEGTVCHQFVNLSLLTDERELCRMYIDMLKCFRLHMLLYHEGDCTFTRIDRIMMATYNNVFRKKEGFIRSHCNSYFNLTSEEHILPAEGAICSSADMIQHVMSQCNANKVNMTTLDTEAYA